MSSRMRLCGLLRLIRVDILRRCIIPVLLVETLLHRSAFIISWSPCPALDELEHGLHNGSDKPRYWFNEKVTFRCLDGYHNTGATETVCMEYGLWSHQNLSVKQPNCQATIGRVDVRIPVRISQRNKNPLREYREKPRIKRGGESDRTQTSQLSKARKTRKWKIEETEELHGGVN